MSGTLTINPAPLSVTYSVANASSTYGTLATLGAVTLTGLAAGDVGNVQGSVSLYNNSNSLVSLSATLTAGSYSEEVTALTGSAAGNYVIASSGNTIGTLSVNQALLTITANSETKTYGSTYTLGASAYTVTGMLYGSDKVSAVTLASGGAAGTAPVTSQPYAITASGATGSGLSNYSITYVPGTLTVKQAPLTITANTQSATYGQAASLGTGAYTVTGTYYNNDYISAVTLTSTGATSTSPVGAYAIVPSNASGTGASNYAISYVNGSLTVNPAALTIAVSGSVASSKIYDGTAAALVAGDGTLSGVIGSDAVTLTLGSTRYADANVGTDKTVTGSYSLSGAAAGNYQLVSASFTSVADITARPITVTADALSKYAGSADPGAHLPTDQRQPRRYRHADRRLDPRPRRKRRPLRYSTGHACGLGQLRIDLCRRLPLHHGCAGVGQLRLCHQPV